jgi:hypothetical protein
MYDAKHNLITDPELASRDYGGTLNYSDFCGYACVPRNPDKKRMQMYNPNDDRIPENYKKEIANNLNKTIGKNAIYKRHAFNKTKQRNKQNK